MVFGVDARGKGLKRVCAAVDTDPDELEDAVTTTGNAAASFEIRLAEAISLQQRFSSTWVG